MGESRTIAARDRPLRRRSESWMLTRTHVSPSLVGRRNELASLADRRRATARGHGALVLIEGEAGIGKTRLVRSFCETLTHGRATFGIGLCREFGNPPFGPIGDALKGVGCAVAPSTSATRTEELIELRARLAAASRRTTVLVLEDIQWADESTLAFLHYLVPSLTSMRLLIVATQRDDVALDRAVETYLTRIARDRATFRIALGPLSPGEIRSLIRSAPGGAALPQVQIEEIVHRAEGNPFFAEELLATTLGQAEPLDGTRSLPRTIGAAVMERMAKLDATAFEIATRAAVVGQRFEAEFLTSAFGYSASDVLAALRRLCDLKLIAETGRHLPAYVFRHALTRDAVYGNMLADEVRPLHARILETYETRGGVSAWDLGYHAWAARDASKCRYYNERAGDEADSAHAYSDAVRCYERALEGDCQVDDRARILIKAGAASSRDGMAERSAQLYGAAAIALDGRATPQRVAELYYAMGTQARLAGDNRRAMAIIERAAQNLPEQELRAKALLRVMSAFMNLDHGDVAAARDLIAQAEAASDLPIYQNAIAYAALNAGDVPALRTANAAHERLSAALGPDHVLRARFNHAFNLCILGFDAEAIAGFDVLIPALQNARLLSLQVLSYANAAIAHGRAGRLQVARDLVACGLAIPEPATTGPIALASAGVWVGQALADAELVERSISQRIVEAAFSSRINSTLGRLAGPYARWLHATGEAAQAKAVLRRATRILAAPLGATETILAAAELGDDATRDAAWKFLRVLDGLSHLDLYAATAQHLRALQAKSLGAVEAGREYAMEAARIYQRLGWPLHEARVHEIAGERDQLRGGYTAIRAATDLRSIEPLSTREREVAALVASGTANNRIAKTLALSERTIEKHLTAIYAKLGLRNRAELAAFVTASGTRQAGPAT